MIDRDMQEEILYCAQRSYEAIALDYLAGFEDDEKATGEDAVEPTMWQMELETDNAVLKHMLTSRENPHRKQMIEIVKKAIGAYF